MFKQKKGWSSLNSIRAVCRSREFYKSTLRVQFYRGVNRNKVIAIENPERTHVDKTRFPNKKANEDNISAKSFDLNTM